MFDTLTRQENTELWTRLQHATSKLHAYSADLSLSDWQQVADTELDILGVREDLTRAYQRLCADA